MIDRLQNYYGIAIRSDKIDLKGMQSTTKDHNLHYPHCPVGPDSWCKCNQDRENGTTSYKPGLGFPISIVMRLRSISEDISNEDLLKKV